MGYIFFYWNKNDFLANGCLGPFKALFHKKIGGIANMARNAVFAQEKLQSYVISLPV